MAEIVGSILGVHDLDVDTDLFRYGMTSMQVVMVSNQLERKLGFRPRINDFYQTPTISALVDYYRRHRPEGSELSQEQMMALLEKVKKMSPEEARERLDQHAAKYSSRPSGTAT